MKDLPAWPQAGCSKSCCEDAGSVMDVGLADDESASIVIIGGGPHALAALSALHDGAPAAGSGSICVIDPGSHFMESWNSRFDALEIKHLRSPTLAHPAPFDPTALLDFATEQGRTNELIEAPQAALHGHGYGPPVWLPSTDLGAKGALLKALPSSALFRDFCASLEAKLPHKWLSGSAVSVCKDEATGKLRVHYTPKTCSSSDGSSSSQRERRVAARAVILATGPVGKWSIPAPFAPYVQDGSRLVLHTEAMLSSSQGGKPTGERGSLSEEITRRCPGESARVLILGGGISAAQAALAAYRAGHHVVLRSRKPLTTKAFDVGSEWLDVRTADRLRFEFLCLPYKQRRQCVREATPGGSVPANYMDELLRLSSSTSSSTPSLRLEMDEAIESSEVCVDEVNEMVTVNGETYAMIILATGTIAVPSGSHLYQSIEQRFHQAQTVEGLPKVDHNLRWVPNEDLFVLGANAMLELGPGGGNLMGAMRGARVVAHELHGLMGKTGEARPSFGNMYASLGDRQRFKNCVGHEAEIDVLATQLNLSPQAETALRKARKSGNKASRRLKQGERDPMKSLTSDLRRAAYA